MLKRALYRDTDGGVADLVGNGVAADAIGFTPAGSIAATDVQAAIEEVASEAGGSLVPDPSGQPDNKWLKTASGALVYTDPPSGATFGTPAIVLGTAAAAGSTDEAIRRDSTIIAFDATAPTTQAFADAAAVGTAAFAARRDHKHAMPVDPLSVRDPRIGIVPLKAGGYWYVPSGTIATGTLTVNNLYVTPYWLPKGLQIDRIGIVVVSNTANSTFNPAIYADTGNFEPGARLIDGGSLDTHTSAGNKEASITWTVPANGVYWFGGVPQTAVATMSCFSNVGALGNMPMLPYNSGSTFPGGNFTTGYNLTGVTGTPPDPFGTPTGVINIVPRITFRTT